MKSKLRKSLDEKKFVFTAETSPPDSGSKLDIINQVKCLKNLADAINVTDGAGANSHMSALATAAIIAENQIEPILQFTTRDRNRLGIQGDLLGGWALNIPNILCLYGDEVKGGDQPEAKEVRDLDTIGLLKKIRVGVEFFQTQYAFDEVVLERYMGKLNQLGITSKAYFIVGLGIIKSAKNARWMNKNLFGISIPENIIKRIENSDNEKEEGTKICIELIEKYKSIEGVSGVHLMGYKQEEDIASVISHFK
jgi:5,10-methylenetetrahydrofolate reductase